MGLFDRLLGRNSDRVVDRSASAAPDAGSVTEDELREAARLAVLPGFVSLDEAVEEVRDYLELDVDDPRPRQVVAEVWSRRKAEEATWVGGSDHARLAGAFTELEVKGLVARMNFTCCNTCGTAEIDDERTPLDAVTPGEYPFREWAYTFFHQQDAELLAEMPATLHLTYSSFRPAPDTDPGLLAVARTGDQRARRQLMAQTDVAVGHLVATSLRSHGLDVEWSGDIGQRIAVTVHAWRKPLPS